ncbi:hypothetical protein IV479_17165, partial [Enterococcus faecalis]|nr:hypothetical protein [Enterococcus faecalis]
LEKQSEPEITAPENEKPRVKKERVVDPEAEARRAARRAERAAKRKQREQD